MRGSPGTQPIIVEADSGERRLAVLDGFRAVAILAVLLFHYTFCWTFPMDPANHFPAASVFAFARPLRYGWIGVEFFFIISGFVILLTLERCASAADFFFRRVARLWPPMLVIATLTAIIINGFGPPDWRASELDWLASVFFVDPRAVGHVIHRTGLHWVDGAYWSLGYEVRFYAVALLAYVLARRRFIETLLIILIAGLAFERSGIPHAARLAHIVLFIEYLPYFLLGCCLFRIFRAVDPDLWAIAAALVSSLVILIRSATDFLPNEAYPEGSFVANAVILLLSLGFVLRAPGMRLFAFRPLVAIGQASYSLYLLHELPGILLLRQLTGWGWNPFVAVPFAICVMLSAALLLHRYIEMPFKTWIHRHTKATVKRLAVQAPWQRFEAAAAPLPRA